MRNEVPFQVHHPLEKLNSYLIRIDLGGNTRFTTPPPSRRRQNPSVDRQSNLSSNFRHMLENFSANKNQSNQNDTIKNLQRLLEETLTKNMHLQNNLEAMALQLQNQS